MEKKFVVCEVETQYLYIIYMKFTRSGNKVMRLVPKSSILFIHQLQCGHLQSTSLAAAHTFSSDAAIVCSIPGKHFVGCRLRLGHRHLDVFLLT
jgi:hypothetical protein